MTKRERSSSSTTSSGISPAPSTASMERREPWGWCYADEPPAKAWTPDIRLPEKRQRRSPRKFPAVEPYSDETEEQARARACRIEVHENRKHKRLVVAVPKSTHHRKSVSRNSRETGRGSTVSRTRTTSSATPKAQASQVVCKAMNDLSKETMLERQLVLLGTHQNKRTKDLEVEVARLRDGNKRLYKMLDLEKNVNMTRTNNSDAFHEVNHLRRELANKWDEIEEKIQQISSLRDELQAARRLSDILDDFNCDNTLTTEFSSGLSYIESSMGRVATILSQCVSNEKIIQACKTPGRVPSLDVLLESSLERKNWEALLNHPKPSFCALIFSFIRNHIFYSDDWKVLYFQGFMLQGYQEFIQKSTPQGTLEAFHKAALGEMLEKNHQFRACWVQSHASALQTDMMNSFKYLIDTEELKSFGSNLENSLNRLFCHALEFRARCIPPPDTRYEILQFRKGDDFDPRYMEAQEFDGSPVYCSSSELAGRKVDICIHGCLVSHEVNDTLVNIKSPPTLSEPFVEKDHNRRTSMKLKSGRAVVILEGCRD